MIGTIAGVAILLAAGESGPARAESGLLADLDSETVASLPLGVGAGEVLDAFLATERAYRFDVGLVVAWTDPRWYGVSSSPAETSALAPVLEIRRWPGDSLIAYYALAPDAEPSLPGIVLASPRDGPAGWVLRDGHFEAEGDRRRVVFADRAVGEGVGRCAALLVPGDAGLGGGSLADREAELLAVLARTALPHEAWKRSAPFPSGPLQVPILPHAPRAWDERRDPWQAVEGPGFTLGFPPGIVARRLDTGISTPSAAPGALLWFRGHFVDRDGTEVVIGDGRRAGYVIERDGDLGGWRAATLPPAGAATASRRDRIELDRVAVERSGARAGWVASWGEPGFAGIWLVFGLDFGDRAVEIGIPVVHGRRSLALFWIPVTWRDAPLPPAPPPIDPASRFGIRFEQSSHAERSRRGPIEGTLVVPGLRLELPRGWWPSATLRSADGFPVLLIDERGGEIGRLERIASGPALRAEIDASAWQERPGARSRGATAIYLGPEGASLFLAPEGHGWKLTPVRAGDPGWGRVVESVTLAKIRPAGTINEAGQPPF